MSPKVQNLQLKVSYGRSPPHKPMALYEHAKNYAESLGFTVLETDPAQGGAYVAPEDVFVILEVAAK